MRKSLTLESPLRKLGALTLVAFTIKGIVTASLIVWTLMTVTR